MSVSWDKFNGLNLLQSTCGPLCSFVFHLFIFFSHKFNQIKLLVLIFMHRWRRPPTRISKGIRRQNIKGKNTPSYKHVFIKIASRWGWHLKAYWHWWMCEIILAKILHNSWQWGCKGWDGPTLSWIHYLGCDHIGVYCIRYSLYAIWFALRHRRYSSDVAWK